MSDDGQSTAQKLADAGAKMESAGQQMSSCGFSLVKLGCSGFLLILVVLIVIAALTSSGHSDPPAPVSTTPKEQATTPAAAEAPALNRNAATGDFAHECGNGTSGNAHTSCAFAEKVRFSFAGGYEALSKPPATIAAYSPTTNREYTLRCYQVAHSLIECTTGTAAVVFPSPDSTTSTPPASETEQRPSGLYGIQTKAENEEAGCMYGFRVSEHGEEQKVTCDTQEEGQRAQEDEGE
jgi:hypothetical protein